MAVSLSGLVDEIRDAARELDAAVSRSGLVGRFTSTYRSHSEQERLYRAFIAGRHSFPVAPPGSSAHEYGEAFDYVVSPPDYQRDVGLTWVSWGGEWGGAGDVVHFELPGASARAIERGQSYIVELADKYNDLPWWASLALPVGLATVERTPQEQQSFEQKARSLSCRLLGIGC